MRNIIVLAGAVLAVVLSAAGCRYDGPDAERYFSGRPSSFALALGHASDGTVEGLTGFLRVPSHVDLHGFYADTYQTDLNNILRRMDRDRFAAAYASLTEVEREALRPYIEGLEPEVRGLRSTALDRYAHGESPTHSSD